MLKQVTLLSEFEGKTTSIKIAECKHQIKFLTMLFAMFSMIPKCELLVTDLKYNNFYFDHFFKEEYKDSSKQVLQGLSIFNE